MATPDQSATSRDSFSAQGRSPLTPGELIVKRPIIFILDLWQKTALGLNESWILLLIFDLALNGFDHGAAA
jgi:hypothetical protein